MNFGESFNSNPVEAIGDGDGTVNKRSLIGCEYWKNTPAQEGFSIYQHEFTGVEHYDILGDSRPIDYIMKTLFGDSGYTQARRTNTTSQNIIMRFRLF